MKITSIIENTSQRGLAVEHGLSLYIEMDDGQKVLFDMGQSDLFVHNAEALGLSIADVDLAVISHGHYDHGGGLKTFLAMNQKAQVYIHRDAFQPHYSLRETGLRYIGLDKTLQEDERLVMCEGVMQIGNHMMLFSDVTGDCCKPMGNQRLFGPTENVCDTFGHEQSLIIEEGDKVVLLAGCAHCGIVNILRKAEAVTGRKPTHVLAGMHLVKSGMEEAEEERFIATLAKELMHYDNTLFYTMHCTGEAQYDKLRALMESQIEYLACGESVVLEESEYDRFLREQMEQFEDDITEGRCYPEMPEGCFVRSK